MWNWANNRTKAHNIPYSRYIASWTKVVKKKHRRTDMFGDEFMEWLMSIGVSEEEALDIRDMADNGKMELEANARLFLEKKQVL